MAGKCTCTTSDDCPGSSTCGSDGKCIPGGRCVLGNFMLRQWCEDPVSRCAKSSDGTYPKECNGSPSSPGVTDVPPFFYNQNLGRCFMTKDYCTRFGVDYSSTSCTTKSDCSDGMDCYKGYCTGQGSECVDNQKTAEFFLGKTLFRMFKSGTKCFEAPKNITNGTFNKEVISSTLKNIYEGFNKLPNTIEKMCDPSMIKSKTLMKKDFIEGIDLYLIIWKDSANIKIPIQLGYDINQIKKKYPSLVKKNKGLLYIKISKQDIGKNNDLKRIYLSLGSSNWMTTNIANSFMKTEEYKKL